MDNDKLFIDTINTMMSIQSSFKENTTSLSLVKGEDGVLMFLFFNNKTFTLNYIADYFEISSGRISNIVLSLEKKGLIEKVSSSSDKREKYLSLTDKGREYSEKLKKSFCDGIVKIISLIGEKEYYEFLQRLKMVAEIIEKSREVEI